MSLKDGETEMTNGIDARLQDDDNDIVHDARRLRESYLLDSTTGYWKLLMISFCVADYLLSHVVLCNVSFLCIVS